MRHRFCTHVQNSWAFSAVSRGVRFIAFGLLAACSSEPTATSLGDTDDSSSGELNLIPDGEDRDSGSGSDIASGDDSGTSLSVGGTGTSCTEPEECESLICLQLVPQQAGFCSGPCATDANCPDEFACLTFTDTGSDAEQRCVPVDLCIDSDGDGYGIGPGCAGPDCNDEDDTISPAADELCDGIDQDCDGMTDENPSDVRRPCDTGFPGRCQDGTTSCRDALLFCDPVTVLTDEVCDDADNDCNGAVDDAGACTGQPCCLDDVCEGVCAGAQLDDTNSCVEPASFGEEVCDGLDNDCDGEIDEDVTTTFYLDDDGDTYGDPDVSVQACSAPDGYVDNADDCDDSSELALPGGTETCDDLDNNCDGETDEGVCAGRPCCWSERCEGICATAITDESGACVEPDGFGTETCDGRDNDCNGVIDDGFDTGTVCTAGVGACLVEGTVLCLPDGLTSACNAVAGDGTVEVCDGVDNDCDGTVDDGFSVGEACSVGQGACAAAGVRVCSVDQSGSLCDATPGAPTAEVCDGIDNDCDGDVDDEVPGAGGSCDTGAPGECAFGTVICDGGVLVCDQNKSPSVEVCDGIDNSCDGNVDEGYATGGACSVGAGACQNAGVWVCNAVGDGRTCDAVPGTPSAEVCDGIDNDCDNAIDEGNPGGGLACDTGLDGVCGPGVSACAGGRLTCIGDTGPSSELCDGLDNNCDGNTDESYGDLGASCSVGTGACARTGLRECSQDGTGTVCSVTAGEPTAEVCGNGIDEDCNGVDSSCPGVCDRARTRIWLDNDLPPEAIAAFAGAGRTITEDWIVSSTDLGQADVIAFSTFNTNFSAAAFRAWVDAGGTAFIWSNDINQSCVDANARFDGVGISFDCGSVRAGEITQVDVHPLTVGLSAENFPYNSGFGVVGGTRLARVADGSTIYATAEFGCGRVVLMGDTEFSRTSDLTGANQFWVNLADWLINGP